MAMRGGGPRISVRDADALIFIGAFVGFTLLPLPAGIALLVGAVPMLRTADPGFRHLGFIAVIVGGFLTVTGGIGLVAGAPTPTPDRIVSLLWLMAIAGVFWFALRVAMAEASGERTDRGMWPGRRSKP
jgi:4-hydroxybenzoate polyprenyltransferase